MPKSVLPPQLCQAVADDDSPGRGLEICCDHVIALTAVWLARLAAFRRKKTRVVIWGIEEDAASVLPMLQAVGEIPRVADEFSQAPEPGTRMLTPADLVVFRPDLVLIGSPARYRQIVGRLRALGLSPALEVV